MPPYPEKQSALLVRLKQKKPLMEAAENGVESSAPAANHNDEVRKLPDTAVKPSSLLPTFLSRRLSPTFRFISINQHRTVFSSPSILQNRTVITRNPFQSLFHPQPSRVTQRNNFSSRTVTSSSRMKSCRSASKVNRTRTRWTSNCTTATRPQLPCRTSPARSIYLEN